MKYRRVAAWIAALALMLSGCSIWAPDPVMRNVHGHLESGPFVPPEVYAAYLQGVIAESHGDFRQAESAYVRASHWLSNSADIWTRIGSVRCAQGVSEKKIHTIALQALEKARTLEPDYAPAWVESARCYLQSGELASATSFAERAVWLDPTDASVAIMRAQVYDRMGDHERAARWLDELVVRAPANPDAWRALLRFAIAYGDEARRARAQAGLGVISSDRYQASTPALGNPYIFVSVDEALSQGFLQMARTRSDQVHLSPGALAVRAAALGFSTLALEQSELVLNADPSNRDAFIAMLVARDMLQKPDQFVRLLLSPTEQKQPEGPSLLATLLLAELVGRKAGADAMRNVLQSLYVTTYATSEQADPLAIHILKRLRTTTEGLGP